MTPFEAYLRDLRDIHSTGGAVDETSYYGALERLLTAVGKSLKPSVRCVMGLKNRGAGMPDGGFFTPDQFQKGTKILKGPPPSRGALEAKGVGEDVYRIAKTKQVAKYLSKYSQVLITTYRGFLVMALDQSGKPVALESYHLAESEPAFWGRLAKPAEMLREHEERLTEYLKRVMLRPAIISTPEDAAWFLASYARDARSRIEAGSLDALQPLRSALEEALGVKFEGAKGEQFFRSSFVQTLFYGIFSAWVLWSKKQRDSDPNAQFNWHDSVWHLHVPIIRALFSQLATPTTLGPLGLEEVIDWAAATLNRIDRQAFFNKFTEGEALQYFYEPFLEAFDPELRKQLGVWYTPTEVVSYMVQRVDTVLREELGVEDGFADKRVYVLDPACGTGAYPVEILRRIEQTLRDKGEGGLVALEAKRAATERIFGFELLPAPLIVSHLQLGLFLQKVGASVSEVGDEREQVFLTNALTGWEPPQKPKTKLPFPGMEEERDAAERVKQDPHILVILGNPPYDGFAGVAVDEERALTTAYRTVKRAPAPEGQGLNNLFVRFFRMAERRIVEKTGKGVVCFITPYTWLDGRSFTGMRERYLEVFDRIWIDSLNGDKFKTGKVTPDGEPDPSVFSTELNREGIKVGTAIALLVRKEDHAPAKEVLFRDFWGKGKRAELLAAVSGKGGAPYQRVEPVDYLGLPFIPMRSEGEYGEWPSLPDLFPVSFPGVKTSRDDVVVDISREGLFSRMEKYFDPQVDDEEMRRIAPGAMEDTTLFKAGKTRAYLQKRGFLPQNIVPFSYRPFDRRWLYWEPETKLLDRNRPEYFPHVFEGNFWLAAAPQNRKEFNPPYVSPHLCSLHVIERGANLFPLLLRPRPRRESLDFEATEETGQPALNLSDRAKQYLSRLDVHDREESLFYHAVAVLHSPAYASENAGALSQDWPRIPLPEGREELFASAALGQRVGTLLNTDVEISGVTSGSIPEWVRLVAKATRTDTKSLGSDAGDLEVNVNWGHRNREGAIMPGKGRAEQREYTAEERVELDAYVRSLGLSAAEAFALLGETTYDIYLNSKVIWQNIPAGVWHYTIGGYQAIKKWLSFREHKVLGRAISLDELREVTKIARRITTLLLLGPTLDTNYLQLRCGHVS